MWSSKRNPLQADDSRVALVLKIASAAGTERHAGEVLEAFDGGGMVRTVAHAPGVVLMERLDPGTRLSTVVSNGNDAEATAILAGVIASFSPTRVPAGTPTVNDWGDSFARYLESGGREIPPDLVRRASAMYSNLCASQRHVRLLHGDLHHDNVLFDATRGWTAIDPKGVVGELEYEVGAALRNPIDLPEVFTSAPVIATRVRGFSKALHLDPSRVVGWAFAQVVLALVWMVEDGERIMPDHPWLTLARALDQGTGYL